MRQISVCKREYFVTNIIKVVLNMFTAGTDMLGCFKSDRLWFLLKGRNQSLSYGIGNFSEFFYTIKKLREDEHSHKNSIHPLLNYSRI